MSLLLGVEPFQMFGVVGGQKVFLSSTFVQTLDLDSKLNNQS